MSFEAKNSSSAPSASEPAAASTKWSPKWSADIWLSAPSHIETFTTLCAPSATAISLTCRMRLFISACSCIGGSPFVDLGDHPRHHIVDGPDQLGRERRAKLERARFDGIDDAAARKLAEN